MLIQLIWQYRPNSKMVDSILCYQPFCCFVYIANIDNIGYCHPIASGWHSLATDNEPQQLKVSRSGCEPWSSVCLPAERLTTGPSQLTHCSSHKGVHVSPTHPPLHPPLQPLLPATLLCYLKPSWLLVVSNHTAPRLWNYAWGYFRPQISLCWLANLSDPAKHLRT